MPMSKLDKKPEFDPFARPIPGESLTKPPGSTPWERPPRFTTPDEVLGMITDKLEDEERMTALMETLMAGAPIETIVNTISLEGVTRGEFTPDVAELIKAPLSLFLLDEAMEREIPVQFFNEDVENRGKDKQLERLKMMKNMRPEMFEALQSEVMPQEVPMEAPPMMAEGGFIKRKGKDWMSIARTDPEVKAWYDELRSVHKDIPKDLDIVEFMKEGMSHPEGYDYKSALESGIRPNLDPESGELHWSSRTPDGVLLKGPKHKTLNRELELNPEKNFSPAFKGYAAGGDVKALMDSGSIDAQINNMATEGVIPARGAPRKREPNTRERLIEIHDTMNKRVVQEIPIKKYKDVESTINRTSDRVDEMNKAEPGRYQMIVTKSAPHTYRPKKD